jgi:tetratricopeptide (TPR) repeat protein
VEDAAELLVRQAHTKREAGEFLAAERLLAEAQSASGGDLGLLEMREDLRLKRSEHRLAIAARRAAHDPHPRAAQLVGRLEEEHNRLAIDLLGARAERLPTDWAVRLELARRLKRAGNFSGAVQRLDEAAQLKAGEVAVLLELGECWQHLRQFEKASDYYQQAIQRAPLDEPPDETLLLARYRAAVLGSAMGNVEFAREQLSAIIALDPAFKDARERLDKLGHS